MVLYALDHGLMCCWVPRMMGCWVPWLLGSSDAWVVGFLG